MWFAKGIAAAKHALLTLLIAILAWVLVFIVWFPGAFAEMMPGTKLFLLVLGVEVVLGPCMSLVIYNPAKPKAELYRDYAFIILVQLLALLYGLYTVAQARPVYIVFVKDRLELVAAGELNESDVAQAEVVQFHRTPWFGIRVICPRAPVTSGEREYLLFDVIPAGKDIQHLPQFYQVCADGQIYDAAYPLVDLRQLATVRESESVMADLTDYTSDGLVYKWLPVVGRMGVWVVLVNPQGELVKYFPFDPF